MGKKISLKTWLTRRHNDIQIRIDKYKEKSIHHNTIKYFEKLLDMSYQIFDEEITELEHIFVSWDKHQEELENFKLLTSLIDKIRSLLNIHHNHPYICDECLHTYPEEIYFLLYPNEPINEIEDKT